MEGSRANVSLSGLLISASGLHAASTPNAAGTYCSVFDLTQTRKLSAADRSLLHLIDVDDLCSSSTCHDPYGDLFTRIEALVQERGTR